MSHERSWVDEAKRNAALEAVKHVKPGFVVGLGSGSTAAYAIRGIGEMIKRERVRILGVPTSYQAFMLAVENKIPVGDFFSKEDLAVVVASTLGLLLFFLERSPLIFETDSLSVAGVTVLVFLALTIRPIWVHPLRKRLTGWIVYEVLKTG